MQYHSSYGQLPVLRSPWDRESREVFVFEVERFLKQQNISRLCGQLSAMAFSDGDPFALALKQWRIIGRIQNQLVYECTGWGFQMVGGLSVNSKSAEPLRLAPRVFICIDFWAKRGRGTLPDSKLLTLAAANAIHRPT
jgi:hypothetical protein